MKIRIVCDDCGVVKVINILEVDRLKADIKKLHAEISKLKVNQSSGYKKLDDVFKMFD